MKYLLIFLKNIIININYYLFLYNIMKIILICLVIVCFLYMATYCTNISNTESFADSQTDVSQATFESAIKTLQELAKNTIIPSDIETSLNIIFKTLENAKSTSKLILPTTVAIGGDLLVRNRNILDELDKLNKKTATMDVSTNGNTVMLGNISVKDKIIFRRS